MRDKPILPNTGRTEGEPLAIYCGSAADDLDALLGRMARHEPVRPITRMAAADL